MLVPKKMKGAKKVVLTVVTVTVGGVIAYLLFTNIFGSKFDFIKPLRVEVKLVELPQISSDLGNDFLQKSVFLNLTEHGNLPVKINKTGRSNPFLEIPFSLVEL